MWSCPRCGQTFVRAGRHFGACIGGHAPIDPVDAVRCLLQLGQNYAMGKIPTAEAPLIRCLDRWRELGEL